MAGREMIVGREYLVGASPGRDYDELMEMGAEAHPHAAHPAAPPHAAMHPAHHPMVVHPAHAAMPVHHAPPAPHYQESPPPPAAAPRRRRLVSEEPTHERQFPIGFILENIAPGVEEDIEVKPQVYFRGERLAIPPSLARYFDIMDIKVGKDSQLAATGAMPGESFSSLAVGVRMELDTAQPGIVLTLRVKNIDTNPQDFKAVLYGAVLE